MLAAAMIVLDAAMLAALLAQHAQYHQRRLCVCASYVLACTTF